MNQISAGRNQHTSPDTKLSTPGCSCSNFVNKYGYGRCLKNSRRFGYKPTCYVNLPSDCKDLNDSTTDPDKKSSAQACLEGTYSLKCTYFLLEIKIDPAH